MNKISYYTALKALQNCEQNINLQDNMLIVLTYLSQLTEVVNKEETNTESQQPKYGDEVLVSDSNRGGFNNRIFICNTPNGVLCVEDDDRESYKKIGRFYVDRWRYYKLISQKVKISMQDISDKFKVDIDKIEIF